VVDEFGDAIWMDAGDHLTHPNAVDWVYQQMVRNKGFYSDQTEGGFMHWTHPGILRYFGVDSDPAMMKRLPETIVNGSAPPCRALAIPR
jgi:hypothetical protein